MTPEELQKIDSHIQKLSKDLANFIVLIEQGDDQFSNRLTQITQQVDIIKEHISLALGKINDSLTEFGEVMTAAGAARWRMTAEETWKKVQSYLEKFAQLIDIFDDLFGKNMSRFDEITIEAEKRVAKILSKLSLEYNQIISQLTSNTEKRFQEIDQSSEKTLQNLKSLQKRSRIELVVVAFLSAFITSFLMGLYINAEWPWESFHRAKIERHLGKQVLLHQQSSAEKPTLQKDL